MVNYKEDLEKLLEAVKNQETTMLEMGKNLKSVSVRLEILEGRFTEHLRSPHAHKI